MCSTGPSPPRMLAVTGTPTGSTVELNWLPPLNPNGDIRYEIEYKSAMPPGDTVIAGHSSSLYFTLTLPNDLPSYTVRVRAVNSRGSAASGHLVVNLGKSRIGVCYDYFYVCYSRKCHHCMCIINIQLTFSCAIMKHTYVIHVHTMTSHVRTYLCTT